MHSRPAGKLVFFVRIGILVLTSTHSHVSENVKQSAVSLYNRREPCHSGPGEYGKILTRVTPDTTVGQTMFDRLNCACVKRWLLHSHAHNNARHSTADIDFRCALPRSQAFTFLESSPSNPVFINNNLFITIFYLQYPLRYHPGRRILISSSHLNALLPKIRGATLGVNHLFVEKHKCERP